MYVTREDEWQTLQQVCMELEQRFPELHPGNTVVLMVSPDYSATVAMHVAHALSKDREMLSIIPVEVPYPKEDPFKYEIAFIDLMTALPSNITQVVLVEAAVISGKNYTWMCEILKALNKRIITVAQYESASSQFHCDVVGRYYHGMVEFYFERDNKNWDA